MMLAWSDAHTLLSALMASHFLLLRQKKVSKEKATPGLAPGVARFLALLGRPGGWLNSPAAQTTPADYPRRFSVARRSTRGPKNGAMPTIDPFFECYGAHGKKAKNQFHKLNPDAFPGPLSGAEQRRRAGGFWLALFEPQASLASRPAFRVAQGSRQSRPRNPGSPFLCLLSFGEAKESETPSRRKAKYGHLTKPTSSTFLQHVPQSLGGWFQRGTNAGPRPLF